MYLSSRATPLAEGCSGLYSKRAGCIILTTLVTVYPFMMCPM
jgi:hypothetical protein